MSTDLTTGLRDPSQSHRQVLCPECDGVGWTEGGATLQTTCTVCKGTGALCCERQHNDPIHRLTPNPTEEQTSDKAMQPPSCEHYWASVHEPGHRLYWIRQCMLCHRVDWDELDAEFDREVPTQPEIDRLRAALARVRALVDEQAEDEGLWFVAATAPETYLQQELRRLHAAIEGPDDDDPCPICGGDHDRIERADCPLFHSKEIIREALDG